ncbi:predicted protein [Naegleria gruberi]|uniref:Predicted protein n=1 Tax=Naegleria gruberi TaxID=5762 RepID=D2VD34_NAEGR|nr:uncharacterized protein NAEGRDRAFT_48641 [Naegleria gruberi]EFC45259.1 predicted protein [Naegleria gruberi]|eukprot:XP_002678003.1 predicted protein [Naegleria gruberi strain NEG-M]
MSTVIVLGANGYIGLGVAQALQRNGFTVHGAVRSDKHEHLMWSNEITPLILPNVTQLFTDEKYENLLWRTSAILDCVGLSNDTEKMIQLIQEHAAERFKKQHPKLLFLFTSGILTYGTNDTIVDETFPQRPNHPALDKRREVEFKLLNEQYKHLDNVVIRPGFVYGKSGGGIFEDYFKPKITSDNKLIVIGSPHKKWSWVHVDDLSEAYVKVLTVGRNLISGQVFNVTALNDHPEFGHLRIELAKLTGWKPSSPHREEDSLQVEPIPQNDLLAEMCENSVIVNPRKAMEVLGWRPKHLNFLENGQLCYQCWKHSKNQ